MAFSLRLARAIVLGHQHQSLCAAIAGIGDQCGGFFGPRRRPIIEALQRVDGTDLETLRFGQLTDGRGGRAIEDGGVVEIVADLDRADPERGRKGEEVGDPEARGRHVVEGKLHGLWFPPGRRPIAPRSHA